MRLNLWKGIGFIIHTCVVQHSLCYVGSSMCLHSKIHRSMSLVSFRPVAGGGGGGLGVGRVVRPPLQAEGPHFEEYE